MQYRSVVGFLGGLAVAAAGACAGSSGTQSSSRSDEDRATSYVPKFDFRDTAGVRTDMQKLAMRVDRIDRTLRDGDLSPEEQAAIVKLLTEMETITSAIAGTEAVSSHLVLEDNIEAFRADLAAARHTAAQDPPSYFLAGAITGSCVYCHR